MSEKNSAFPPFISTGDPGSFAQYTMTLRLPAILDSVIADNEISGPEKQLLLSLKHEIQGGYIDEVRIDLNLFETEEREVWQQCLTDYGGKPWGAVPWYVAEALFYFRLLVAFGYFDGGSSFYGKDPFEGAKRRELFSRRGGLEAARRIGVNRSLKELVFFSLWGNRIDLSRYDVVSAGGRRFERNDTEKLIIDHSERLTEKIRHAERIDVVTDNGGTELVCDLALARQLLECEDQKTVHFHMKKHPIYVSDATVRDAGIIIEAMRKYSDPLTRELGERLACFTEQGRLLMHHHYFWNSPLHFPDFTPDLSAALGMSDIVMLKGDVNYRRLLSDRRWPHRTRMEEVTHYFPATFAVLRTLKSEIAVDLDDETVSSLSQTDPEWMVNGERGIIRVVEHS